MRLKDKTAVITGASSGIGRASIDALLGNPTVAAYPVAMPGCSRL